ncbi:hypothetical protein IWW50_004005 [Coemansia erecta]|nr:hypothetical protein GGF43_000333 [Coemansia sp. RSA 2618]KAJ2822926.1 hypothetical protein IWW50_004005 [Coemansia erecta]
MERNDSLSQADLQPLFDSSISLPQDKNERTEPDASPFGRLPTTSSVVASTTHSRNASYGTSLLDTLNEERNGPRVFAPLQPVNEGARAQHTRAHTLTASQMTTNATGMLGAHVRLGSVSGMSPPGTLTSALRNSYSSNSLRTAFARRSEPSEYDVAAALDEGVWGPSRLSNELDLLSLESREPDLAMGGRIYGEPEPMGAEQDVAMGRMHARSGSSSSGLMGDALARMRSYSFNSPPDMAEEPDIDMLHTAARAQNPTLAFRKMMARTHARSKTLAGLDAETVHIGIGGTGSATHSRQPSQHVRTQSAELDDGVPTRSLWVGNVDPGLSSQDLVARFGQYGRVESLRLLPDKECAFVNFLRVEDAVRAREDMHAGARIGANTVRVGYGKGESYATGDAQAMQPTRALWIGNIAAATTPDALGAVFRQFGAIDSARVLNHKNCGFVNFVRLEDAVRAKQAMNGKSVDGAVVRIGYAKVPPAKSDAALKLRNPVPSAAPLTASGQRAEADALTGTTQRGLGSDAVLEPGFSLAIDEDLVAFPYAAQLPPLPDAALTLQQPRLRELRKLLDASAGHPRDDDFDRAARELLPHVVELCTDYVGNVLVQRLAERATSAQRLALIQRVAPHMAAVGVHKNGTWAVQKLIDCAESGEQRRVIVRHLRAFVPQLLLDQLGNYVVQGCLKFGCDAAADESNQFVFDAIHARCLEVAQGRFGARAMRTCLESPLASRLQQKLVAVALVTNAAALATNANGHLLVTWLLDSSRFQGRMRVLAHQLAPHLRYLATHKLGAAAISKLVDQAFEADARDLVLNTLFFNPDPSVLDDVLADHLQGVQVVLRILQGSAIGDAEKARIADRVRSALDTHRRSSSVSSASATAAGNGALQRLHDTVASVLAHSQPVYPPAMAPVAHRISVTSPVQPDAMPMAHHFTQPPQPMGFHHPAGAMSFPVNHTQPPSSVLSPPAGFGGMVGAGQMPPFFQPPVDTVSNGVFMPIYPPPPPATSDPVSNDTSSTPAQAKQ